jgi:hypothetical protein
VSGFDSARRSAGPTDEESPSEGYPAGDRVGANTRIPGRLVELALTHTHSAVDVLDRLQAGEEVGDGLRWVATNEIAHHLQCAVVLLRELAGDLAAAAAAPITRKRDDARPPSVSAPSLLSAQRVGPWSNVS